MKGESRQTRNVYTWDVGGGEVGEGVPGVDVDGSGQVSYTITKANLCLYKSSSEL